MKRAKPKCRACGKVRPLVGHALVMYTQREHERARVCRVCMRRAIHIVVALPGGVLADGGPGGIHRARVHFASDGSVLREHIADRSHELDEGDGP